MLDVVFLDFAKAFDIVPHRIPLHKLSSCETGKYVVLWLGTWL